MQQQQQPQSEQPAALPSAPTAVGTSSVQNSYLPSPFEYSYADPTSFFAYNTQQPQAAHLSAPTSLYGNQSTTIPVSLTPDVLLAPPTLPANDAESASQRRRFTPEQTAQLRAYFAGNSRPSDVECKELGQLVGLQEKQVRDWFTRERKKENRSKDVGGGGTTFPAPALPSGPPSNTSSAMSAPVVYNPMLFSSPQVSQWIQWAKSQDTSGSLHGTQAYPVQTYFPIAGIPYPIGLSPNLQQQSMPALQQPVGVPTTLSAAHSAPAMPALTNAPPTVQFPQEKSPQSPMEVDSPLASPSIELSFDESLDALLNSERKLKDEEQVPKLVKLAMNFTGWPERLRILSVLNATTDKTILGVFMQKQGLKIVHKILLQAKDAISDADAIECANTGLRVLTQLPVDLQDLKDVKTGKLVKFFTTIEGDERLEPARQTAKELMTAWKSLIPKKEEDQRKRDTVENKRPRDTAESEESQAKKPKSDPGSSKRADFEKKKVQAVDNFDIFKTLSHSALPKIKKAEKAVSKPTVATQNLPQENDITEPSTTASPQSASEVEAVPTTASSMLIDDGSVRSYRTSGGDRSASPDSAEDNKPKKKRVRFKDDSELVQIKYFESEPAEYDGEESLRTPHVIGDARDLDRQEGHMAFKPPTDATIDWETPSLISWPQSFEWGKESTEARIQEERERGVVMATYYSDDQIPPSPAEPAEEPVAQMEQLKIIPLDVPAQPAPSATTIPPNLATLLGQQGLSGLPAPQPPPDTAALLGQLAAAVQQQGVAQPQLHLQSLLLQQLQQSLGGAPVVPQVLQPSPLLANLQQLLQQGQSHQQFQQPQPHQQFPQQQAQMAFPQQQQHQQFPQQQPHLQPPFGAPQMQSMGQAGDHQRETRASRWGPPAETSGHRGGSAMRGRGEKRPPPRDWSLVPQHRRTPCRFFPHGLCTKGDKCTFRHDPVDAASPASQ